MKAFLKKLGKALAQFAVIACLSVIFIHFTGFAESSLPISDETIETYKNNMVPGPYSASYDDGIDIAKELLITNLLKYFKIIIGVVAILMITIMGYQLVTSGGDEEKYKKTRDGILYAVIGLVLISMAQEISKIFDMSDSTLLQSPQEILKRVKLFDTQVELIITVIKYVIGAIATLMMVISGVRLVVGGAEEDEIKKQRTNLMLSALGLVVVLVGGPIITKVFYNLDVNSFEQGEGLGMSVSPQAGINEVVGITNFLVSFMGPIALVILMVAALMYITASGEQDKMDKARRIIIATLVGIVIIYGAFAIVSTIVAGSVDATIVTS